MGGVGEGGGEEGWCEGVRAVGFVDDAMFEVWWVVVFHVDVTIIPTAAAAAVGAWWARRG